jgi:AraC-like DNA-binding protein
MRRNGRRYPRQELDLEAALAKESSRSAAFVQLRNISRAGAFFIADQRLQLEESVEIKLGSGLRVTGTVVRATPMFGDRHGIAVRFESLSENGHGESGNGDPQPVGEIYQLELKECSDEAFEYYPRLTRVRDFVRQNLEDSISLAQAAEVAAMEKTYFSFFFHEKVGVTFRDWLQYLRITRALEMMAEQDHSITEIAFAVGFNELSTFQKAFKRWTSLTPRDFKRLARPA